MTTKKHVTITTLKDCEYLIQCQLHYFCEKAGSIKDEDEDLSDDEFDELDEIEYFETEASKLITKGDTCNQSRW